MEQSARSVDLYRTAAGRGQAARPAGQGAGTGNRPKLGATDRPVLMAPPAHGGPGLGSRRPRRAPPAAAPAPAAPGAAGLLAAAAACAVGLVAPAQAGILDAGPSNPYVGGPLRVQGAVEGAAPTEQDRLKDNTYVQNLVKRSQEKREEYDKTRLDNFYKRNFRINEITGMEILPEPCDPRDPEFAGTKGCAANSLPPDDLFAEEEEDLDEDAGAWGTRLTRIYENLPNRLAEYQDRPVCNDPKGCAEAPAPAAPAAAPGAEEGEAVAEALVEVVAEAVEEAVPFGGGGEAVAEALVEVAAEAAEEAAVTAAEDFPAEGVGAQNADASLE